MVIVPVLFEVVLFAATEKVTLPLPELLEPEVTVSHDVALLTAVHAQPEPAVTFTVPVPAAEAKD